MEQKSPGHWTGAFYCNPTATGGKVRRGFAHKKPSAQKVGDLHKKFFRGSDKRKARRRTAGLHLVYADRWLFSLWYLDDGGLLDR